MKDNKYLLGALALNFFVSLIDSLLRVNGWPVTFSFGFPLPYIIVYQGVLNFSFDLLPLLLSFLLTFAVLKVSAKLPRKIMDYKNTGNS